MAEYPVRADLAEEVERLRAENARLKADAARMDWLEAHTNEVRMSVDDLNAWFVQWGDGFCCGPTLRATTDRAMEKADD